MSSTQYMERAEQVILHTYNRFPVVFDHGEGVRLYDADGREYLDFVLDQLSLLEGISYRPMMGEYVIYFQDKVIGGIYDD